MASVFGIVISVWVFTSYLGTWTLRVSVGGLFVKGWFVSLGYGRFDLNVG